MLKLCRYFDGTALLGVALRDSAKQLVVPLFMLCIILFCVASVTAFACCVSQHARPR